MRRVLTRELDVDVDRAWLEAVVGQRLDSAFHQLELREVAG